MMACFTIIFGFMARLLHLDGYSKQIYAVIFGFWIRIRKPVYVPYSVIRRITGATDPTISECIKRLERDGVISAERKSGTRTKYVIVLTDDIWKAYLEDSGQDDPLKITEELSPAKETTKVFQETTKILEEHKNSKINKRRNSPTPSNLVVSSANSVSARIQKVKINGAS